MFNYSINIRWSEEDEGYIATISEFPGLSAFGETPEKAAKEAIIASELFILDMIEDGEEIPKPKKSYSSSFNITDHHELIVNYYIPYQYLSTNKVC
ncbi:antitoxin HicB [Candidatus Magnetomoraceae bacterium gMMP-15]